MLAAQQFEGGYFRNRARPDVAFIFPQDIKREQAEQWKDEIAAMYSGPENAGKPTVMGGGVEIKTIPVSMQDAQFIESKKLGIEEIGRIMDVEPAFLGSAAVEQLCGHLSPARAARLGDKVQQRSSDVECTVAQVDREVLVAA